LAARPVAETDAGQKHDRMTRFCVGFARQNNLSLLSRLPDKEEV
jgi:hypothetical protein